MTNVAVIPIDNRPICYDLIEDILSTDNNINIHMPDLSLLGGLCSSSNIEGLFNFIESLPHVDYFVVALDTLAYGGLVTSRRCEESFDTIKKRIEKLKNIIPKNARVLAFSSVMRISNNNINEEEKPYWAQYGKKIFEWSYEKGKEVWKYGIKDTNELYTYIPPSLSPSSIPPEILDDYLNTRKRNFEINKLYLDMAREGFFDTLIFSKDDCAQFGLNVEEAIELENIIKRDNILNTYIKTGADEIPLTLLARALSRGYDIKINPLFIEPQGTNL
ncbi:DUF4127 family protein, partial [bacterium]|nr:DUF4127 family protein [bacterium]